MIMNYGKMINLLNKFFKSNKKYIDDEVFSVCFEIISPKYDFPILQIEENKNEYRVNYLNYEYYSDMYDYYDDIYQDILKYDNNSQQKAYLHEYCNSNYFELNDVMYSLKVKLQGYLLELNYNKFIGVDDVIAEGIEDDKESI